MCGRFELKTKFEDLPKVLKQNYPRGLDTKYETQNLIRPSDPVLVIKNEAKIKTLINYFDAKKKLFDVLAKTKKSIENKKNAK